MKYIIFFLLSVGCVKPKSESSSLFENKDWYLYKEVLKNETFNYSKQYWLKAENGKFSDYDKYQGTYQLRNDVLKIYFFNYGYETYYIEQVDKENLILNQRDSKGVLYRRLYFRDIY